MQLKPQDLQHIRQSARSSGISLLKLLLERFQNNTEALRKYLLDHHGIVLLTELELDSVSHLEWHPHPPHAQIQLADQNLLVFADPWSLPAIQELAQCSLTGIRLAIASTATLDHLENQNTLSNPVQSAPNSHLSSPAIESASDAVAFVQKALETAFQEGASDVHFECDRAGIRTKFRLDGVMSPGTAAPSVGFAEQVISRIKVLSSLDITERRKPQDGRFRWSSLSGKATDIRVSIMPSIFGEDAVLRLLDRAQLRDDRVGINLSTLGFDSSTAKSIRSLATRPHGMLLVTGPTGSGKTTTVYAALSETSNDTEKIITIEDPVEYELPGVLQIPVNEQKGLTFATGLRSILRHDPDKILVGEIRDPETAEISIQAALTGHLVFTTVHANSLFDVLGRFQHFGVDPFALASALNGVLIQRLLRQLCRECKDASPETDTGLHVGCPACRHTGYKGRLVVSEVLALDNTLRDLIINRATISELTRHLELKGHVPLLDIAMECVRKRLTTREEVERVIGMA